MDKHDQGEGRDELQGNAEAIAAKAMQAAERRRRPRVQLGKFVAAADELEPEHGLVKTFVGAFVCDDGALQISYDGDEMQLIGLVGSLERLLGERQRQKLDASIRAVE